MKKLEKIEFSDIQEAVAAKTFVQVAILHLLLATVLFTVQLVHYLSEKPIQLLVLMVITGTFILVQSFAIEIVRRKRRVESGTWITVGALYLGVFVVPILLDGALPLGMTCLFIVPLFAAMSGQLKRLPNLLFLTFLLSVFLILLDLSFPFKEIRYPINGTLWRNYSAAALFAYMGFLLFIFLSRAKKDKQELGRIDLATLYALVIGGISALAIILVTSVLITQIRNDQINQAGKNFQTMAENFAKLAGSHLEQQMQKLQLISEQIPVFKERLREKNLKYEGNRLKAKQVLRLENRYWQGPDMDRSHVMSFLNNPIIETLSRFRGHNSFHNDLLLVDGFGGLVASLGQKPEKLYFYDEKWWNICWNGGLGNIFIGDLTEDSRAGVPKLRIAVDIIDHTNNKVIGMLSSMYLLRTMLEDIERFKPESVEQISLVDSRGRIIAKTGSTIDKNSTWPQFSELLQGETSKGSGWELAKDLSGQAALIGFSPLSTAYNVISDPLDRLGWYVLVSGTRSNALTGVTQSTKIAMLAGLLVMAFGVLGAIAGARVISKPIEKLTATASAMSEGNLSLRAELGGPEELVALSKGFNKLTKQLGKVIEDLRSQTEQLEKAKSEAEAATKLKGEFLANMSHEIRTPLNAILGFADILDSHLQDKIQKRHAQTIKSSGKDLLHLINDILDLSKIEAGRLEIQPGPVDLRSMFVDLKRIFSIAAQEKKLALTFQVADDIPENLLLDGKRLKQVLFNLLGNGVKFTQKGGVSCNGYLKGKHGQSELIIEVSDTGVGIDPRNYELIFEAFQQQGVENAAGSDGTGLGLAITKSLVEMMGGTVSVNGHSKGGTTFRISLPGIQTASALEPVKGTSKDIVKTSYIAIAGGDVLIVDDLEVNRNLLMEKLKDFPLEVYQARGGAEAIELINRRTFDLVLLDIKMPGVDGYQVISHLQSLAGSKPYVVALTASGMKEDIQRIQSAGFDDYLIRPFELQAFVNILERFLPASKNPENDAVTDGDNRNVDRVNMMHPWSYPPEAKDEIYQRLLEQWKWVSGKQSIPEIQDFAENVAQVGVKFGIELLRRYGEELVGHTTAFDIENVEKLLKLFVELINNGKVAGSN